MKRLILALAVASALALGAAQLTHAQDGHGDEGQPAEGESGGAASEGDSVLRGAAVYAGFCQACHGPQGEGAAQGPAFPAISYNHDRLLAVLDDGADSDPNDDIAMPAYNDVLSDEQMADLDAYMATWGTGSTPPLPAPNIAAAKIGSPAADYPGDAEAGAALYAIYCSGCHGRDGEGRGKSAFPSFKFDGAHTIDAVVSGTDSRFMPAFSSDFGGPLTTASIADLAAYMSSWPAEESSTAEGLGILVLFAGIGAILAVGVAYMARRTDRPTN